MSISPQHQPSGGQIKIDRIMLQPEFALQLLRLNIGDSSVPEEEWSKKVTVFNQINTRNRKVSHQWVISLARYIEDGQWVFDGSPIRIGFENGKPVLIDGQHRCLAVIRSGKPIDTLYLRGLQTETQLVMDTGKKRSFGDYLTLQTPPVANAGAIAVLTRFLLNLESDRFPDTGDAVMRRVWSNQEQMNRYTKDEDLIQEAVRRSNVVYRGVRMNRTAYGAFWFMAQQLPNAEADIEDFQHKLATGTDLPEKAALISFRHQVTTSTDAKFRFNWYQYGLLVKAWNAYRLGRKIGYLTFRPGGKNPEKMPTVQ